MKIREVLRDDYPALCSLINNELGYPKVEQDDLNARMELMENDSSYSTFVAVQNNKIVGFIGTIICVAYEIKEPYMRIIGLAVKAEEQNKGIGRSLLLYAEEYTRSKGIKWISLSSGLKRLDAHRFYENNGYTKNSFYFGKDI